MDYKSNFRSTHSPPLNKSLIKFLILYYQVSRLVIIHEEGEAGHEMPDLERPVQAVSKAVANLAKVEMRDVKFPPYIMPDIDLYLTNY